MKLSKQALIEQEKYRLLEDVEYSYHLGEYRRRYTDRKPRYDVPTKNMLIALRLIPHLNTVEEWARLHACEAFCLKQRKAVVKRFRGEFKAIGTI